MSGASVILDEVDPALRMKWYALAHEPPSVAGLDRAGLLLLLRLVLLRKTNAFKPSEIAMFGVSIELIGFWRS